MEYTNSERQSNVNRILSDIFNHVFQRYPLGIFKVFTIIRRYIPPTSPVFILLFMVSFQSILLVNIFHSSHSYHCTDPLIP